METQWAAFLSGGKKKTKAIFPRVCLELLSLEAWEQGPDCSHMDTCTGTVFLSSLQAAVPVLSPVLPGHLNTDPRKTLTFTFYCSLLFFFFLGSNITV